MPGNPLPDLTDDPFAPLDESPAPPPLRSAPAVTESAVQRPSGESARLNPAQLRVFTDLLAVSADRPHAPTGLVDTIRARLTERTADALSQWPERTLWFGKSQVSAMGRCEGMVVAEASAPRSRRLPVPTAIGIVAHRAIQLAHTHGGDSRPAADIVDAALQGALSEDGFADFWRSAAEFEQSDVITGAVSTTIGFLDAFPPLDVRWSPRFEESMQAKVGRLTLAVRPDLVLGRQRDDMRQTMFLCDVKTADLRDDHLLEARFYALVATLRHSCPPFRSTVYSISSGEWTDPDITPEVLLETADVVADRAVAHVELMGGHRPPVLTPDRWCAWCAARSTCPSADPTAVNRTPAPQPVPLPTRRTFDTLPAAAAVPPSVSTAEVLPGASETVTSGAVVGAAAGVVAVPIAGDDDDPFRIDE
jgi:hypothetical protein